MRAAGGSLLGQLRVQPPADEDPVRLFAGVDAVSHLAVEVDEVFACLRAELVEVEVRVAPHEWIERPHDLLHATLQAPGPLMLLEREREAARLAVGHDAEAV